jgi:L-fuconolactonase
MTRREFLVASGSGLLGGAVGCTSRSLPRSLSLTIIDCHTHFYDPSRPKGVPWPGKNETFLYRTVGPADYLAQKVPTPVSGTVVVEASPWVEDNQWLLDLAARHAFIVGFCGHLNPADDSFATNLERFAANPLYRGIRISGGTISQAMRDRGLIAKLGRLSDLDLQLDVNVSIEELPEVERLAKALPRLRIVVDHLANTSIDGRAVDPNWRRNMEQVAAAPNVFAKISGLVEGAGRSAKPAPAGTKYYAPWLDVIWNAFGEDRLIYGSNWPVSELFAPLFEVQRIVEEYFAGKGRRVMEKVFAGNASVAYRWRRR